MSLSCPLSEAHYCGLQSQTNVYGLAKVSLPCGQQKLLIASLRGKVISMEFQKTKPLSKEVPFTYIPSDAEILSIDAFNRQHGIVVGITFVKTSNNELCQYLNIYSGVEPDSNFNLDSIALGCHNLRLDFMPYQLYHTEVINYGTTETVFLLGGSDGKIHLYREEKHLFVEEPIEDFFPELTEMPSSVTCMDVKSYDDYTRRISAVGCQSGLFRVTHANTITKDILSSWEVQFDSPVMSLSLFTLATQVQCPVFVKQVIDTDIEEENSEGKDMPDFHLAVASAIEPVVVYRSIIERGLVEPLLLSESAQYDAVLCVTVADVDFDGENEVLIGTYGQELLVYKYYPQSILKHTEPPEATSSPTPVAASSSTEGLVTGKSIPAARLSDTPLTSTPQSSLPTSPEHHSTPERRCKASLSGHGEFQLLWQRSFPDPVMGLDVADLTGDGLQEVIISDLKGLHVLQHDLSAAAELCLQRLKSATQRQPGEDIFQQLLAENLS